MWQDLKLNWNKKYTTIAVYACLVIFFTVILINFMIQRDFVGDAFALIVSVLSPIIYGVVIAYLLNPIMMFFEKKAYKKIHPNREKSTLRRGLALATTYLLFVIFLAGFLALLLPQLIKSIGELVTVVTDYVSNSLDSDVRNFLSFNEKLVEAYDAYMQDSKLIEKLLVFSNQLKNLLLTSKDILVNFFVVLKDLLLGIFFSIYFLASKELLGRQFSRFFKAVLSSTANSRFMHIVKIIDEKFGQFIRGKLLDSFIVMCIVYLLCWIFGIPYYPMIALIIGVTDLIPVFGPFLGAIPSAIIIFIAEGGGFWKAIWFAVIILIVQQIDGNILAPLILGEKVGIEGVWIMTAVVIMGGFFGILGMFFGVPIFAVIYTLLGEWVHTRLVAKGVDPASMPESPHTDETKLFGFTIHLPRLSHSEEKDEELESDGEFSSPEATESNTDK
jgi:predicted PurR-regulated permease PerM